MAGPPRAAPLARAPGGDRARWPPPSARPTTCIAPDGTRYVSFADWLCPDPLHRAGDLPGDPGAADLGDGRRDGRPGRRLQLTTPTAGPVLFVCRHRVFGVGMFDAAECSRATRMVAEAGAGPGAVDVLVGTVSGCHGAASLLHLGAEPGAVG